MNQEVIEKHFTVGAQARLALKNISGDIHIEAGEPGLIYVKAVKRLERGDPENTQVEISQAEDGSVLACTHYPPRSGLGFLTPWSQPSPVTYTVRMPPDSWLQAEGVSSNLTVVDLHGDLDLRSVSGTVRAAGLAGRVQLNSVSGSVTGENLAGQIEACTVSGSIRLSGPQIASCRAHSTSGQIHLAGALKDGPYHLKTISGSIRMDLPGAALLNLKAHSFSGKVHLAPQIQTGAGGAAVRADSLSGHIWVQAGQFEALTNL